MKIVISYNHPDMDGTACMYAYSELLNRKGIDAQYYIWDMPTREVEIVCNMFNIKLNSIEESELKENDEYIAVDLNGLAQMHSIMNQNNIIQVIDHHAISKTVPLYLNADVQIERLGAAATIVAEKYKLSGLIPSRESAIMLYYGIISNSINLKANITNKRDIEITEWLKTICSDISEEKIRDIFIEKSKIEDGNLRRDMECEIPMKVNEKYITIGQIEVANLEEFLKENKDEMIKILMQVKKENNLDYIYVNCVDILNGYTIMLVPEIETQKMIERVMGYKFEKDGELKLNKIIQRKEMTKKIRTVGVDDHGDPYI